MLVEIHDSCHKANIMEQNPVIVAFPHLRGLQCRPEGDRGILWPFTCPKTIENTQLWQLDLLAYCKD